VPSLRGYPKPRPPYRYQRIGGRFMLFQRLTPYAVILLPVRRVPRGLRQIATGSSANQFIYDPRTGEGRPVPSWDEIST